MEGVLTEGIPEQAVQAAQQPEAAETVAPEIKPESPVVTKDEERLAARFSALSKKEKDLVLKERGLKDQLGKIKEFEERQLKAKDDPIDFITRSGLSLDDILNAALGKKTEPTEADKIVKLREELESYKKQQEEEKLNAKKQQEELAIANFKKHVIEQVKAKPDEFEIIQAKELYEDVYSVIEENFNKTGKIMDALEAAKLVEDYYAEDIRSILSKTKKFQAKTPESPKQEQKSFGGVSEERVHATAPTLTNKLVSVSAPNTEQKRLLSNEESIKKAASIIRWTN